MLQKPQRQRIVLEKINRIEKKKTKRETLQVCNLNIIMTYCMMYVGKIS